MREQLKDAGRLQHMLEMAELLNSEKDKNSISLIKQDRVLFYGL